MNQITMKKDDLLAILRANRDKHRMVFLEAQQNYRKMAIAELERTLEDARNGRTIRRTLTLNAPQDMTSFYNRAIGMLEAHTEDTIVVSDSEYRNYVQDEWSWSQNWANNTKTYATSDVANQYLEMKADAE